LGSSGRAARVLPAFVAGSCRVVDPSYPTHYGGYPKTTLVSALLSGESTNTSIFLPNYDFLFILSAEEASVVDDFFFGNTEEFLHVGIRIGRRTQSGKMFCEEPFRPYSRILPQ
jgi:hypothetical protein